MPLEGKDIESFEDLEVFQRAYRISLEVHRASLELPSHEQFGLADQLRRASKSICANLAEGFGLSKVTLQLSTGDLCRWQ